MGKVFSVLSRKLNRFNVENRAHRILDKQKETPRPAPKYEGNIRDYKRMMEEHPEIINSLNKKNIELDNRLKDVYVTSEDQPIRFTNAKQSTESDNRSLPLDRSSQIDYEYGFKEPDKLSHGRTTLRQAIDFITKHQGDPNTWTIQTIAEEHKLKENVVDNILKYYQSFQIHIPTQRTSQLNLLKDEQQRTIEETKPPNFEGFKDPLEELEAISKPKEKFEDLVKRKKHEKTIEMIEKMGKEEK